MDDRDDLCYIANHIFCPPKLPQQDDLDVFKERALCVAVHDHIEEYQNLLPAEQKPQWIPVTKMLRILCGSLESNILSKAFIKQSIAKMYPGGMELVVLYSFLELIRPLQTYSHSPFERKMPLSSYANSEIKPSSSLSKYPHRLLSSWLQRGSWSAHTQALR